jgi:hypothetical protein
MHVVLDHPVLIQPEKENATIWRYMSFAKFVSFLEKEALFFSRISMLSDASEGRLPWRNLREWNPRIIGMFEYTRNTTAVNCWHMRNGESWAMWQAYCGLTEGIAIKSSYKRLTECFKSVDGSMSNQQVVYIGMVRYLDYEADLLESNNGYAPLMCKRSVFEDDHEVRAMLIPDNFLTSAFTQRALPGLYMPVDVTKLADAVVVAPGAPDWMLRLARSLVGTKCPVKRSSIAVSRYPDSPREIELAKKIEAKVEEYVANKKALDDEARHPLLLAAMGQVFAFKDEAEFLAHRLEEEFVHQYIDWRINNASTR